MRLLKVLAGKTLKRAFAAKRIAVETDCRLSLVSVGSAIASFAAGKRTTEMDGQAQMRMESAIEPALLGERAVEIAVFYFQMFVGGISNCTVTHALNGSIIDSRGFSILVHIHSAMTSARVSFRKFY